MKQQIEDKAEIKEKINDRITKIERGIIPEGYKQTEIGIIPQDWEVKKLGDLGEVMRGKGIPKTSLADSGLPCIIYGELYTTYDDVINQLVSKTDPDTAANSFQLEYGDILFASSGETPEEIGKSAMYLNTETAYAGGDMIILRPKNDIKNEVYGYLLNMDYIRKQKYEQAQGHSVVHLYADNIKSMFVPFIPKNEQQKIADIITNWDRTIELKESLIKEKEVQKKGLMQKLFVVEKSKGWRVTKLGDLLVKIVGGGTPSRKIPEYYSGSIPWATVKDLINENYKTTTMEYISKEGLKNSSAKVIEAGNFIVSTRMGLGRGFINKVDMAINQDLKGLYPNKDRLDVAYLMYWYKSQKRKLELLGSGSTVKGIDLKTLKSLKVVVPPLSEQNRIAEILSIADQEIDLLKQEVELLKEQKKGLMQLLLTGLIRVKGDNDE